MEFAGNIAVLQIDVRNGIESAEDVVELVVVPDFAFPAAPDPASAVVLDLGSVVVLDPIAGIVFDVVYDAMVHGLKPDAVVLDLASDAGVPDSKPDAEVAWLQPDSCQNPAWQSERHELLSPRCHLC